MVKESFRTTLSPRGVCSRIPHSRHFFMPHHGQISTHVYILHIIPFLRHSGHHSSNSTAQQPHFTITVIPPTTPHTPLLNPVNPVNPVQNFYTLNTIYTAIIFSFRVFSVFRGSDLCVLCSSALNTIANTIGSDLVVKVTLSVFLAHAW